MRRLLAALAIPAVGIAAAALIPAGSSATFAAHSGFDGKVAGSDDGVTLHVLCPGGPAGVGTLKPVSISVAAGSTDGSMGSFAGSVVASLVPEVGAAQTLHTFS